MMEAVVESGTGTAGADRRRRRRRQDRHRAARRGHGAARLVHRLRPGGRPEGRRRGGRRGRRQRRQRGRRWPGGRADRQGRHGGGAGDEHRMSHDRRATALEPHDGTDDHEENTRTATPARGTLRGRRAPRPRRHGRGPPRATTPGSAATVAIKMLRSDLARDPRFLARFRREAQSAAGLNHASIVAVYDSGEDHVDRGRRRQRPGALHRHGVRRGPDPARAAQRQARRCAPAEAARITEGVLDALAYSHRMGIVHRDIKPANVMIGRRGPDQGDGLRHRPRRSPTPTRR